jgi:UDP-glucuronate 4-epimerase
VKVLVTGAAGFIGFHVSLALLDRGDAVIGADNLNDYYDVALKDARLAILRRSPAFTFHRCDLAERAEVAAIMTAHPDLAGIVHLAAQPGVRYSLINPLAYVRSNIEAHVVLLEAARGLQDLRHFVYASSSAVYGRNAKLPFSTVDRTDQPASLYGASKKAMEVISDAYAETHGLPLTGLRFFTVYGPWGRPDMAPMLFAGRILAGQPIPLFNQGDMRRDFTFIDDIVAGVIACLDRPPPPSLKPPHRLYNLGNHRPEPLTDFVAALEEALGRKAIIELKPMQPGEMKETYADIEASRRDLGFAPRTAMRDGIPRFVAWYREYDRTRG